MARTTTSPECRPTRIWISHAVGAPHLLRVAVDARLHVERGVAGADGVVLVGERRAEERHDPVAHDLVHHALVLVDGLDHALEHRVDEVARLLGVAVGQHLHRALEVGEDHRHLLALALEHGLGVQDALGQVLRRVGIRRAEAGGRAGGLDGQGALGAELGGGGQRRPAAAAVGAQLHAAVDAIVRAGRVLLLTATTLHARGYPPCGGQRRALTLPSPERPGPRVREPSPPKGERAG